MIRAFPRIGDLDGHFGRESGHGGMECQPVMTIARVGISHAVRFMTIIPLVAVLLALFRPSANRL